MLHLACHPLIQPSCPRCPHDETVTYLNAIGESTTAEFSFQMFQFVGYSEVFLHCRVQLCLPDSPEPCAKVSSLAGLCCAWVGVRPPFTALPGEGALLWFWGPHKINTSRIRSSAQCPNPKTQGAEPTRDLLSFFPGKGREIYRMTQVQGASSLPSHHPSFGFVASNAPGTGGAGGHWQMTTTGLCPTGPSSCWLLVQRPIIPALTSRTQRVCMS